MNATLNFVLTSENQTKDFSYTIFPVKKINVEKILKLRENCYLIILSIHILKLEISGCDNICLSCVFIRRTAKATTNLTGVTSGEKKMFVVS
jgi:hypothetical protein